MHMYEEFFISIYECGRLDNEILCKDPFIFRIPKNWKPCTTSSVMRSGENVGIFTVSKWRHQTQPTTLNFVISTNMITSSLVMPFKVGPPI